MSGGPHHGPHAWHPNGEIDRGGDDTCRCQLFHRCQLPNVSTTVQLGLLNCKLINVFVCGEDHFLCEFWGQTGVFVIWAAMHAL